MPRSVNGVAAVEVASMETTDVPNGLVVPKEDGVVVPLTALLKRENAEALMRWRGESV